MTNPFRITCYGKDFGRIGWIGDPLALRVTPRFNEVGSAQITLPANHRILPELAVGDRVKIEYRDSQILAGRISGRSGKGLTTNGTVELTVKDYWSVLHDTLVWPNPTQGLNSQTSPQYKVSGPLETIAKQVIQAQAITRLGNPITYAPSAGTGRTLKLGWRFTPIADQLQQALSNEGYRLYFEHGLASVVLQWSATATHPLKLTEASRSVREWSFEEQAPSATRVVLLGQGEGIFRSGYSSIDTALEAAYGEKIEILRDARDTSDEDEINERLLQTLWEGRDIANVSLSLDATTGPFQYDPTGQNGIRVGDTLRVELANGVVVENRLTEVDFKLSANNGLEIIPTFGEPNTPTRLLARTVARLGRGFRQLVSGS